MSIESSSYDDESKLGRKVVRCNRGTIPETYVQNSERSHGARDWSNSLEGEAQNRVRPSKVSSPSDSYRRNERPDVAHLSLTAIVPALRPFSSKIFKALEAANNNVIPIIASSKMSR